MLTSKLEGKAILQSPKKLEIFASLGAPLIKLKQSLEFGALEGGESTPDSLKDILVETSNHQSEYKSVKDVDALGSLPDLEADCQRIKSIPILSGINS